MGTQLNCYEVHFVNGQKINFVTEQHLDLSEMMENLYENNLTTMWDYNKEYFIVFKHICYIRFTGTMEV